MPRSSSQKSSNSCALWWSLKAQFQSLGGWSSENYFGTLRSSFMTKGQRWAESQGARLVTAAKGVGTYISRVLILTRLSQRRASSKPRRRHTFRAGNDWHGWPDTNPPHFPTRDFTEYILKFHKQIDLQQKKFKLDKLKIPLIILHLALFSSPKVATITSFSHLYFYTCLKRNSFLKNVLLCHFS